MFELNQIPGLLAALLKVISYQCKTQKTLLVLQTVGIISLCVGYFCLDARSGMALYLVCLARNLIYAGKRFKIFSYAFWPYVLTGAVLVVGALSWQGPVSLLMIASLVGNTIFLSSENVQHLRISILFTSSCALAYNLVFTVWGGVLNEVLSIGSAIVGLIRYRRKGLSDLTTPKSPKK